MKRRNFIKTASMAGIGLSVLNYSFLTSCKHGHSEIHSTEFRQLAYDLLKDWCDGMIKNQIINPENPDLHGALGCPSCEHIHGRCMDAVYPFLHMYDSTGEKKYLDAAILVMNWAENNVSHPDGSWTVISNPNAWKGITVFGAIALAEALYYHGHVLDDDIRKTWTERLGKAANYVYKTFDMTFTNINYGYTGIFALNLFGRLLDEPVYTQRSHEMAKEVKDFFTEPNKLLWGETKPIDRKSPKGLYGVDLGYNVEESLNGVVMYALQENDEEMLDLLEKSLASHMEFMLPDGAWDNSFGTRHNKWSYWGSRTTDGCQVSYGMMAGRNPAFGTVAYKSTLLLKQCTADGLLHGGPHFISHGVKPCIHHTFAHAKPLAAVLDAGDKLPEITLNARLPREKVYGVKEFPEILTWLVAKGPWRGTVTSYDALYIENRPIQQATGGALAVLYHENVGLLFAASMARYIIVEANNQQHYDGEEFALTPRVEVIKDGDWFTNLWDLEAEVKVTEKDDEIRFDVETNIRNEERQKLPATQSNFNIVYAFSDDEVEITARPGIGNTPNDEAALVLPVASVNTEKVTQISPQRIEILKDNGTLVLESNVPLWIKPMNRERAFNLVPGVEAVPVYARFNPDVSREVVVKLSVI
jgi:hypothetical protein